MIIKLQGGLGNQLFQWAYGRSHELATGEEVFFDKSALAAGHPPRRYGLGDYDIAVKLAPDDMPGERLCDYWQNEKLFDTEVVQKELAAPKGTPNSKCVDMAMAILDSPESCFIGVRRADYLWPERIAYHGVMHQDYYRKAIESFPKGTEFFIFTDDLDWTIDHLGSDGLIVNVNGENEKHWDIWLMSFCKHAIIANSTFHWWGAWLAADLRGKVIAPQWWFANGIATKIVPERWIKI